ALFAQNISVVSGNGQVIGPVGTQCFLGGVPIQQKPSVFEPMTVQVTDSSGKPVVGATVTWTIASGSGTLSASTSQTDPNGMVSATFTSASVASGNSFVQSQVTAATST